MLDKEIDSRFKTITEILLNENNLVMKDIYSYCGMSEQTFFSWKKRNRQVHDLIVSGYIYAKIKTELMEIASLYKAKEIINRKC